MFGSTAQKPFSFGNASTSNQSSSAPTSTPSLFGNSLSDGNTLGGGGGGSGFGSQSTSANPAPTSSSTPAIDVTHIRSTTKYDHLQQELQKQIEMLDNVILNQEQMCDQRLTTEINAVKELGSQLTPGIEYLSAKLEELEEGLENDATTIVNLRDNELKHDMGELECVFSNVDRLKIPRQYQLLGATGEVNLGASVLGNSMNNSTGLSGWWNQPQALKGARSVGGQQNLQLVNDETESQNTARPKTMVDLFDARVQSWKKVSQDQQQLLSEIEDFIDGLEDKVIMKEREVNDRLNYGNANAEQRKAEEKQRKVNQLGFVFGEVQRGLYEMAEKVGQTRDAIVELGMLR